MGNVAQENMASRYAVIPLHFTQNAVAQSTTGTLNVVASLATAGTLNVKDYTMPFAGSVFAIAGRTSSAATDGTLTLTPLIAGSLTAFSAKTTMYASGLDTIGTIRQSFYAKQDGNVFQSRFNAGDAIALRYVSTSAFAPTAELDLNVQVYVLLEQIEL